VETIDSKRSYALIWCMPNNDDDVLLIMCENADADDVRVHRLQRLQTQFYIEW